MVVGELMIVGDTTEKEKNKVNRRKKLRKLNIVSGSDIMANVRLSIYPSVNLIQIVSAAAVNCVTPPCRGKEPRNKNEKGSQFPRTIEVTV